MEPCPKNLCPDLFKCLQWNSSSFTCVVDNTLHPETTYCTEGTCLHGGTCIAVPPRHYCLCSGAWAGEDCSVAVPSFNHTGLIFSVHHMHELHNAAVAVGALITAFLLAFLVIILCHCRSTRRWVLIKERCKSLLGRTTSGDVQPIVDLGSLQRPRLEPDVIYFTANQRNAAETEDETAERISSLTGKALKGHRMETFKI